MALKVCRLTAESTRKLISSAASIRSGTFGKFDFQFNLLSLAGNDNLDRFAGLVLSYFSQKVVVGHDDVVIDSDNDIVVFETRFFRRSVSCDVSHSRTDVCVLSTNAEVWRSVRSLGDFF